MTKSVLMAGIMWLAGTIGLLVDDVLMADFEGNDYGAEAGLYHDAEAIRKARAGAEKKISVAQSDPHRPVYHFLSEARWINDPIGVFFADGWYHVFYQHNPYGNEWGHMHWGHARARDNVIWERLPVAVWPSTDKGEDHCYLDSAFVEENRVVAMHVGHSIAEIVATSDDPLLRAYPTLGKSDGVSLQAIGGDARLLRFDSWKMRGT